MKNKFFLLISIFFFNIFFHSYSYADLEFNFEVTEIEVLDNGNIIKGSKGGTVTTNDGLIIKAKEFEYNKLKNILNAKGNVDVADKINNYKISTDQITYLKDEEKFLTQGKTISEIHSRFKLISKDIIFFKNDLLISSNESTDIIDELNQTLYKLKKFSYSIGKEILKGEKIFVNTEFNKPFNDKFFIESGIFNLKDQSYIAKDIDIRLKKNIFGNTDNDPRFKGLSSSSKDGVTVVNKGIFTSCKENDSCPPWTIQAKKITYDKNKRQIIYDDALLKVYDIPIIYFPKFFHPGPTVKRQSGLLAPRLNNSKTLGSSLQVPYFWAISDNKDLTFKPAIFDKDIILLQNEYRQKNKNSSFITDFSFVKGYKSKNDNDEKSVGHFFSEYQSDLNLENFINSSLNVSVEKVNNDTYLKIFDKNIIDTNLKPNDFDVLTSQIELDLIHENYDFSTGFTAYEDLNKSNNDRYKLVLPYYSFAKNIWSDSNYGSTNLISTGDNVLDRTNNLRTRLINDLNFSSFDFINKNGVKNNINFYFKNLITSEKKNEKYHASPTWDLNGIMEIQSNLPLIKNGENFIDYLTPKISLRINPSNDMKDYSDDDRRIDTENLFNIDRLGLDDALEPGNNLTLGIDYKREKIEDINKYFELKLGTVFREKDNDQIPSTSTLSQKNSNYFGLIRNNFNENFSLDYQFSVDNDFSTFEYSSLGTTFSYNSFETTFRFIEEHGKIGGSNIIENKTTFALNDKNYFSFKTRENREIDLTEYYDLIYEYKNDCLIAGIKYNKSYYSDKDLEPSEDFMFTLTLIPMTNIEQSLAK